MAYSSDQLALGPRQKDPVLYLLGDDTEKLESLRRAIHMPHLKTGVFGDPEEMLQVCSDEDVGCILSQMKLQRMDGLELRQRLVDADSSLSLILTIATSDIALAVRAMKRGVSSVLLQPIDVSTLVSEVRQGVIASEHAYTKHKAIRNARRRLERLSAEELGVLNLAVDGVPNREIAIRLSVSPPHRGSSATICATKVGCGIDHRVRCLEDFGGVLIQRSSHYGLGT